LEYNTLSAAYIYYKKGKTDTNRGNNMDTKEFAYRKSLTYIYPGNHYFDNINFGAIAIDSQRREKEWQEYIELREGDRWTDEEISRMTKPGSIVYGQTEVHRCKDDSSTQHGIGECIRSSKRVGCNPKCCGKAQRDASKGSTDYRRTGLQG
jgi:hypothetical protein